MSQQQLMIPEKLKVGFVNRDGTYNGKLAYVIYYDQKGVLRKEKSWQGWRDDRIPAEDFANEPIEGFVLNKKVGGYKSHWNYRDAHVRVYDPRGFEFEISVPNLLFILSEGDCSRGKGLEGKFVYAWEGTELVLLPVSSEDYKNSTDFTNLQTCKVKAKELIPGASYKTKRQEIYVYLGKFTKHILHSDCSWQKETTGPRQVFWNGKDFVFLTSMTSLATLHSDTIAPNFAELVDKYNKSVWGSKPDKFFLKEFVRKDPENHYTYDRYSWAIEESPGVFLQCRSSYSYKYDEKQQKTVYSEDVSTVQVDRRYSIKDGAICVESVNKVCYRDPEVTQREKSRYRYGYINDYVGRILDKYIEPTNTQLWTELENGSQFEVSGSNLITPSEVQETCNDEEDGCED